jgi:hypothetical protein
MPFQQSLIHLKMNVLHAQNVPLGNEGLHIDCLSELIDISFAHARTPTHTQSLYIILTAALKHESHIANSHKMKLNTMKEAK